ncbi:unnamed protein product [Prorocentrum cordatum]|uniref:Protein-serine/threonine kinase n=1 Tax=Prorocentrum cordatum TaxID=2364126 RepID=A0ABN9XC37_9DINO|nr:unnamed protein product [Polarella glacialis]
MALASLPHSFSRIRGAARANVEALSLAHLLEATTPELHNRIWLAEWLRQQLPIRFARRIEELEGWAHEGGRIPGGLADLVRLPHVVVSIPQVKAVLGAYLQTFEAMASHAGRQDRRLGEVRPPSFRPSCASYPSPSALRRGVPRPWEGRGWTNMTTSAGRAALTHPPVRTEEDEAQFQQVIQAELQKHHSGTRLVAEGYREARRLYPSIRLDGFLDTHFTSRIATRILMDNYVEMRSPRDGFVGVVRKGMRIMDVVCELASELVDLATAVYGVAPEVRYRGDQDVVLDYIPRHVKYMVRELLKNAFRATVERHLERGVQAGVPPVVVELQQADGHVIIKISDRGGGLSKRVQREAWQYGWTTVRPRSGLREASMFAEESCSWDRTDEAGVPPGAPAGPLAPAELAGYGFGLPLTRMHAQYFGALPGHGADLYLMLTHLGVEGPGSQVDDLATDLYTEIWGEPQRHRSHNLGDESHKLFTNGRHAWRRPPAMAAAALPGAAPAALAAAPWGSLLAGLGPAAPARHGLVVTLPEAGDVGAGAPCRAELLERQPMLADRFCLLLVGQRGSAAPRLKWLVSDIPGLQDGDEPACEPCCYGLAGNWAAVGRGEAAVPYEAAAAGEALLLLLFAQRGAPEAAAPPGLPRAGAPREPFRVADFAGREGVGGLLAAEALAVCGGGPRGLAEEGPRRPLAHSRGAPLEADPSGPATLTAALRRTAGALPDRGLTIYDSSGRPSRLCYSELLEQAERLAAGLSRRAVGREPSALLQLPGLAAHFAAFWGCLPWHGARGGRHPAELQRHRARSLRQDSQRVAAAGGPAGPHVRRARGEGRAAAGRGGDVADGGGGRGAAGRAWRCRASRARGGAAV